MIGTEEERERGSNSPRVPRDFSGKRIICVRDGDREDGASVPL